MEAGAIIEVSDRARPVAAELDGRYNHEDLVTQSQDGEEGEGKDDTRKVKKGWEQVSGRGDSSHHTPTKTSFSTFVKGRRRC